MLKKIKIMLGFLYINKLKLTFIIKNYDKVYIPKILEITESLSIGINFKYTKKMVSECFLSESFGKQRTINLINYFKSLIINNLIKL